jgi:hypothetical protein
MCYVLATCYTRLLQVLLRAEHVAPVRRLLRLPPRTLIAGPQGLATHSSELLPVKLRGVGLTVQGVAWARELLLQPGAIATVELLYRERGGLQSLHQQHRYTSSNSAASSTGSRATADSSISTADGSSNGAVAHTSSSTLHADSSGVSSSTSCNSSSGSYSVDSKFSGHQAAQQLDSGKRPAAVEGMQLFYVTS